MSKPALEVKNLTTQFHTKSGIVTAVNDISFSINKGEVMGLVGESGCGKSITGYSLMGLVDSPGKVVNGQLLLSSVDGTVDLRTLGAREMRSLRGGRVAMIFQDPMMTLNPVLRIDTQMIEAVLAHQSVSKSRARDISRQALSRVGISAPDERLESYPHQFSGGMRQRVAIAIALLNDPALIIADEPTTALDVTIQGQILAEMQTLCRESGTALIWITHDLSVVAGIADTVSVMYAGRIIEQGSVQDVLGSPRHPYTRGLMNSVPAANQPGQPLRQIRGMAPTLANLPVGCAFRPRCDYATTACTNLPELRRLNNGLAACFNPIHTVLPESTLPSPEVA